MTHLSKLATVSVVALMLAAPVAAQSTLTGIEDLDDRIDQIQEDAETELAKADDTERFGPNAVAQGWRGSLAFSASSTSGSTDTGEISLGTRLTYGIGNWSHSLGLAGEYGRTNKTVTKQEFFGTYEANRYFTPELYMFGLGRFEYDKFGTDTHDGFIGFGPGYRVLNSEKVAWRVQAGPGIRYVQDNTGAETTEASAIASSRFWYGLTDTMSLTNDTDIVYSDVSTVASNDFGINIKMSDTLSTRFGYRTEYNSQAATQYDNKLGVSLVVGF